MTSAGSRQAFPTCAATVAMGYAQGRINGTVLGLDWRLAEVFSSLMASRSARSVQEAEDLGWFRWQQ